MTTSLTPGARVLLDTNILVRLLSSDDSEHTTVQRAATALQRSGAKLHTTLQNLSEFWNVVTRPRVNNGIGLPTVVAQDQLRLIESQVILLADTLGVYHHWRQLLDQYTIMGKQVHDAKLVASMLTHDVPDVLTLNGTDFRRFRGITVLDPTEIAP